MRYGARERGGLSVLRGGSSRSLRLKPSRWPGRREEKHLLQIRKTGGTLMAKILMTNLSSKIILPMCLSFLLLGTLAAQDYDRDSGRYVILNAQYGTEHRHVDVTHRLRELAHNDIQFRMDNHTFGIDPDYGHRKVLRIYARDPNGRERMFEYPEHGWVDGSQFRGWGRGEWGEEHERWSGRWNVEEHEREEHDRR